MALITCPECGREISDTVKNCIHCGYPIKKQNHRKLLAGILIIVVVLVVTMCFVKGDEKKAEKCSFENCTENIYTDGLCIKHYVEKKSGNIVTQNISNEENDVDIPLDDSVEFKIGDTIKEESCEVKVIKYNIDYKVEPPSPDSYYSYFEAEKGNIFVDIIMDIKNLNNTAVNQDEVIGMVTVIYDGTYEYRCQKVTEEDNGKDLNNYPSIYGINPLETMRYHMIAELPKEIEKNGKSLVTIVEIDGTKYKCNLR